MSLINCPECNKEISDKVKVCPNCGYPLEENNSVRQEENITTNKKPFKKRFVIIPILLLIICITGGTIYYLNVLQPQNTYKEAMNLLDDGKYDNASVLLNKIKSYKDVATLKEEIKYESMVYQCVTTIKQLLKNPDSFIIHEVVFYQGIKKDTSDDLKTAIADFDKYTKISPACIMRYGAENGFGGNNSSYAVFMYDEKNKSYIFYGSCDTLEISDIDDEDDKKSCQLINIYKDNFNIVGQIDLARIEKILKNDAYSTIKIIE